MPHRFLRWLALGAGILVLIIAVSVLYVSHQEQASEFCASCHTEPEAEYLARYMRAVEQQSAEDLASFHYRQQGIRCIDCHVGEDVAGRAQVLAFAARNAFKRYTGFMQQPAVIVLPIQNEACLKCHEQQMRQPGFENHMHNKPYYNPEPVPFIRCTDCHPSHRSGDERTAFLFRETILPHCEFCHATVGRGPRGLAP
jgi:nitrate/TMAO reductase-like tetraheme cytochrome c subunit